MIHFARYNGYGDIVSIVSMLPSAGSAFVPVAEDVKPSTHWFNHETGEVEDRVSLDLPVKVDIAEGWKVPNLPGTATIIHGDKKVPGSVFVPDEPGTFLIEVKGKHRWVGWVVIADYAANRRIAYPSWQEQMDALYHVGYDGWREQIEAIKAQFPKTD